MNILAASSLNSPKYQMNKSYSSPSFRGDRLYSLKEVIDASVVSKQDVANGVEKLVNKIKFLNKIVGVNDKTSKPVVTQLGDALVYINMDKTLKGKTKINIFTDTKGVVFRYPGYGCSYEKVENPQLERQCLDILISDKDGRMSQGLLSTIDGSCTNFERDLKSGKRSAEGRYFRLNPNINECVDQKFEMNDFGYEKSGLTIREIFKSLFAKLSLVKPDINLIK